MNYSITFSSNSDESMINTMLGGGKSNSNGMVAPESITNVQRYMAMALLIVALPITGVSVYVTVRDSVNSF